MHKKVFDWLRLTSQYLIVTLDKDNKLNLTITTDTKIVTLSYACTEFIEVSKHTKRSSTSSD